MIQQWKSWNASARFIEERQDRHDYHCAGIFYVVEEVVAVNIHGSPF